MVAFISHWPFFSLLSNMNFTNIHAHATYLRIIRKFAQTVDQNLRIKDLIELSNMRAVRYVNNSLKSEEYCFGTHALVL